MKGDYSYGEYAALARLPNVEVSKFGFRRFIDPTHIKPEEKEQAGQALVAAREAVFSGRYDLVVLDEVNVAVGWNLVDADDVIRLIKEKPPAVELILTGVASDRSRGRAWAGPRQAGACGACPYREIRRPAPGRVCRPGY